jgi:hypothetical protein
MGELLFSLHVPHVNISGPFLCGLVSKIDLIIELYNCKSDISLDKASSQI